MKHLPLFIAALQPKQMTVKPTKLYQTCRNCQDEFEGGEYF